MFFFFFSSRRRHTRCYRDWSSDVCSSDLDGTREVLKQIPDVRLILFSRNQGSGTARRIGTQEARGRVVVWTDADMTYPNELIPELVRELDDDHDQVVGARRSEAGT